MNISVPISANQPFGVSIVQDQRGLDSFRDPACAAALWNRETPVEVTSWLADLAPETLPEGRVVVQPHAVREVVTQLCDIAQMPCSFAACMVD